MGRRQFLKSAALAPLALTAANLNPVQAATGKASKVIRKEPRNDYLTAHDRSRRTQVTLPQLVGHRAQRV